MAHFRLKKNTEIVLKDIKKNEQRLWPHCIVGCSLKSFQSLPKQIPYFDIPTNFYDTTSFLSFDS